MLSELAFRRLCMPHPHTKLHLVGLNFSLSTLSLVLGDTLMRRAPTIIFYVQGARARCTQMATRPPWEALEGVSNTPTLRI